VSLQLYTFYFKRLDKKLQRSMCRLLIGGWPICDKKIVAYEIKGLVISTQGAKSYVLDVHVNGRKKFYTTCSVNLYIGVTQRTTTRVSKAGTIKNITKNQCMINITFPDGSVRQYEEGITASEIAKSISEGLARKVLAANVNGETWDATRPIRKDATLKLLTWNDADGKATFWHSSAHLMAEAVESMFPGVKFWVGPPVENGFYYDMDLGDRKMSEEDLVALEKKMNELAKQNNAYIRKEVPKAEAVEYFKKKGDEYKLDLLQGLEDGQITFYTQGSFTDLCRGPHIPNTGFIKAIKLTNIAGAYWKGDEKNKQLTRVYGITFPQQKELDEYLQMLEEAKKKEIIENLEKSLVFIQWMMMWAQA